MRLNSISQTNFALGSEATITLISSQSEQQLSPLFATIWRTIFTFERRFSRFIPMSELCAFNRSAGIKTIVSEEFKDLLLTATSFAKATNGLYNPFILPALQHAGYKTSLVHGYENDKIEDYSHKKVVNIERLEIGNNWARIPYGTAIDLGGCGKGYLADKLRSLVVANNIHGYWISLSGDVATSGVDELGSNHTIYIQDANNLSGYVDDVIVCPKNNFGIATSGTFQRASSANANSKNWHHIIDPSTLKPAITDVLLVTVCAGTTLQADVLASCIVILGAAKGAAFLKTFSSVHASYIQYKQNGVLKTLSFGRVLQQQKELAYAT